MLDWLTQHEFYGLLATLGVAVLSYYLMRHFVLVGIRAVVKRTATKVDDFIFHRSTLRWGAMLVPFSVFMLASTYLGGGMPILMRIASYALFFAFLLLIGSILHGLGQYFFSTGKTQGRSVKGYVQAINMVIYLYGVVVIAASIADTNPVAIVSGLGAVTAVAILVFRDAILNFVASLTITSNDLIRVGDWIEAPKFNANGIVTDIALYTVKIENFDKTISVIPTYKLIDESFRNWRDVVKNGARRVLRSIYIDQSTIHVCSPELLDRLENVPRIGEYVREKRRAVTLENESRNLTGELAIFGRQLTNLGVFRVYAESYLREQPMIREDLTVIVRQLQPEPMGLPMEVFCFVRSAEGPIFEAVQSDIFDHLISVLPTFELSINQARG